MLDRWIVAPEAFAAAESSIRDAVGSAGPVGLDVALLDDRQRAVLATMEDLVTEMGRVRSAAAPTDPLADHPFVAALEAEPFSPPEPVGVDRAELRELIRRGRVVERQGIWFAAAAIERAGHVVARLLTDHPAGFTASQARRAFGTTRKFALPLLAELDANGVTRRHGDVRVGGPRLPRPREGDGGDR
jgi:selenocysteine-specific elongation factor